jgi:hypothetical protein
MVFEELTQHTFLSLVLRRYDILQRVVQRLSQHNLKFRTIAILKISVKGYNDSNYMYRYVHDLSLCQLP